MANILPKKVHTLPSRINQLEYRRHLLSKSSPKQSRQKRFQLYSNSLSHSVFTQVINQGNIVGIDLNTENLCFVSSPQEFKQTMSDFTHHYKRFNQNSKEYKQKLSSNVLKILEQAETNIRITYAKKKRKKIKLEL